MFQRVSGKRSSSSIRRQSADERDPFDPDTARRDAQVAAALAFLSARGAETSPHRPARSQPAGILSTSVREAPRPQSISFVAVKAPTRTSSARNGHQLKKSSSQYLDVSRKRRVPQPYLPPRRVASLGDFSITSRSIGKSASDYDSNSIASENTERTCIRNSDAISLDDRATRIEETARNEVTSLSLGTTLVPSDDPFHQDVGFLPEPTPYRRLKKSKSMLDPIKRIPSRIFHDTSKNRDDTVSTCSLRASRSMTTIRPRAEEHTKYMMAAGPHDNDVSIQIARDKFLLEIERQRLREQPSFIRRAKLHRQERALRKTVRSSSGPDVSTPQLRHKPSVVGNTFRKASLSFRKRIRTIFRRSSPGSSTVSASPSLKASGSQGSLPEIIPGSPLHASPPLAHSDPDSWQCDEGCKKRPATILVGLTPAHMPPPPEPEASTDVDADIRDLDHDVQEALVTAGGPHELQAFEASLKQFKPTPRALSPELHSNDELNPADELYGVRRWETLSFDEDIFAKAHSDDGDARHLKILEASGEHQVHPLTGLFPRKISPAASLQAIREASYLALSEPHSPPTPEYYRATEGYTPPETLYEVDESPYEENPGPALRDMSISEAACRYNDTITRIQQSETHTTPQMPVYPFENPSDGTQNMEPLTGSSPVACRRRRNNCDVDDYDPAVITGRTPLKENVLERQVPMSSLRETTTSDKATLDRSIISMGLNSPSLIASDSEYSRSESGRTPRGSQRIYRQRRGSDDTDKHPSINRILSEIFSMIGPNPEHENSDLSVGSKGPGSQHQKYGPYLTSSLNSHMRECTLADDAVIAVRDTKGKQPTLTLLENVPQPEPLVLKSKPSLSSVGSVPTSPNKDLSSQIINPQTSTPNSCNPTEVPDQDCDHSVGLDLAGSNPLVATEPDTPRIPPADEVSTAISIQQSSFTTSYLPIPPPPPTPTSVAKVDFLAATMQAAGNTSERQSDKLQLDSERSHTVIPSRPHIPLKSPERGRHARRNLATPPRLERQESTLVPNSDSGSAASTSSPPGLQHRILSKLYDMGSPLRLIHAQPLLNQFSNSSESLVNPAQSKAAKAEWSTSSKGSSPKPRHKNKRITPIYISSPPYGLNMSTAVAGSSSDSSKESSPQKNRHSLKAMRYLPGSEVYDGDAEKENPIESSSKYQQATIEEAVRTRRRQIAGSDESS